MYSVRKWKDQGQASCCCDGLCVWARLFTWVNMLCGGPLGRGQQGWSGAEEEEEEEEGQGDALTVRRHPNPITDCCHSSREGRMDRQGWESGARKMESKNRWRQEKEGEGDKHVCRKRKDKKKLVWACRLTESVDLKGENWKVAESHNISARGHFSIQNIISTWHSFQD